jgi:pimeloyl-ACP methyl ester carboxylesterase
MRGAIVLAVLGWAVFDACTGSSLAPTPGPAEASLSRCDDVLPIGDGEEDDGSPRLHAYCLPMTMPSRHEGWQEQVQAVVLADSGHDPLADRTVLVYHPGGPGISAYQTLLSDPPPIDFGTYALLSWDGTSAEIVPSSCGPDTTAFGTQRDRHNLHESARKTARDCLFGFGGEADVGAWAAAEELEAIRRELGIERFDLLAFSYGTAIAEAYLSMHPEHVRRALLDAPIALEVPWAGRLRAVGAALRDGAARLARSCSTDTCIEVLRDAPPAQSYEALRSAVLAEERLVGSGSLTLTPVMFDQATELALRSEDFWPAYAQAVEEALAGDGSALWRMGDQHFFGVDRSVFYRSICADIDRPSKPADYVVDDDPLIFAYSSELAPCAGFPRGVVRSAGPAPEAPPDVLVVASRHDVMAPAALLALAPRLQSLSAVCVTDVMGHTSFHDPSVRELVDQFLAAGNARAIADRCARP